MPENRHERLARIIQRAAFEHGLSVVALRGDRRDAVAVAARRDAIVAAFDAGFGDSVIGRALGRDRTTVRHHRQAVEARP